MKNKVFGSLVCTDCNKRIKVLQSKKNFSILFCGCREYPLVNGIVYLKNNKGRELAVSYLKRGMCNRASLALLAERFRFLLFISIFLLPGPLNDLTKKITGKGPAHLFGFNNFIRLLKVFGYPAPWAKYLLGRKERVEFGVARSAIPLLVAKSRSILDIGSGVGQLNQFMAVSPTVGVVYSLENSFFNLLLNRTFFSHKKVNLICAEISDKLPFVRGSFDTVIASDSFHYLTKKRSILEESYRVLRKPGRIAILHTVNFPGRVFGNVLGITVNEIFKMAKSIGFCNIQIIEEEKLSDLLAKNKRDVFIKTGNWKDVVKPKGSFSFFAQKGGNKI